MAVAVAALYVAARGCYAGLPDVDAWPEERDARTYTGPHAVVAHPPCARWCRLAGLVESRYGERFKKGEDGGTFKAALDAVRTWGGVLEHPAWSDAWPAFGLATPVQGAWTRALDDAGWVTQVAQSAYGHRARKLTWLYYVGDAPPPRLDWRMAPHSARVSWCENHDKSKVEIMGKREREATPPAFRDLLLDFLARAARVSATGIQSRPSETP